MAESARQTAPVDKCIRETLALQMGWRRLREQDRDDVIQNAHLFLCQFLGNDYIQRIASIIPFASRASSERET